MDSPCFLPWVGNSDEPGLPIDALAEALQLGLTVPEDFFVSSSLATSFSRRHYIYCSPQISGSRMTFSITLTSHMRSHQ